MRFYCERYPELYVYDLDAKFHKGVFETSDKKQIEGLQATNLPITWDEVNTDDKRGKRPRVSS